MRLEGILYFKNSINVDSECLDKEFKFSIAGFQGILAMPVLDKDFKDSEEMLCLPGIPLLSPKGLNEKIKNYEEWGKTFSLPKGDSSVKSCAFWFEIENEIENNKISETIYKELGKWEELFIDNLSILTDRDLQKPNESFDHEHQDNKANRDLYETIEEKIIKFSFPVVINIYTDIRFPISHKLLSKAIEMTNDGIHPKLEFYLLRDAEQALRDNNLRKAILDSATAFELCLINVINKNLIIEQELKDELLKNYNSIFKKRQLLKVLKIELPIHNYQNDFEFIRNKAIHIGRLPTKEEAGLVFTIAKTVVFKFITDKFEEPDIV